MIDRKTLSRLFVLCVGLWIAACGGSDSNKQNGVSGGGGGTGGSSGPAPLGNGIVGKACKVNGDCGDGVCSMVFGANMLMGVMGTPAPGGYCTTTCTADADCGSDGACVGAFAGLPGFAGGGATGATRGQCYASCTDSAQCREGYRCQNVLGAPVTSSTAGSGGSQAGAAGAAGRAATIPGLGGFGANTCQPAPVTDKLTGSTVGSMCSADADCGGGQCMTTGTFGTSAFPGGYCTGRCLQDSDCGNGVCNLGLLNAAGTCYRGCTSDSDCGRDGYRCRTVAAMGSKECVPGAKPLADGIVGKACGTDQDCGGAAMSCDMSTSTPGGYCTQRCVDASDCGADGVCVGGFGAIGGVASGTCYKGCSSATDCRDGYICGTRNGFGFTNGSPTVCTIMPPMRMGDDAGVP